MFTYIPLIARDIDDDTVEDFVRWKYFRVMCNRICFAGIGIFHENWKELARKRSYTKTILPVELGSEDVAQYFSQELFLVK